MLFEQNVNKIINLEIKRGHYQFRFFNFFDQKAKDFEDQNIRRNNHQPFFIQDEDQIRREIPWTDLTYWQSYHYHAFQDAPFYVLQMSNTATDKHYQLAIQVEISKISLFQIGTIEKWVANTLEESYLDLNELINQLLYFIKKHTPLMSIRIQPYMPGNALLEKVCNLLALKGFNEICPKSYTKTRMIDLRPSISDILNAFSANGRARLKIKDKELEKVEVKEIFEASTIPHLQNALDDSYKRSVEKECPFNFSPFFNSKKSFSTDVALLGFFYKDEPLCPKAFITGINHGKIVEYSVGGSLSETKLRQFPFNHILIWQLALKSKMNGSELFDMGGITDKEDAGHLSGISNFKRFFPGFEITTGREMQLTTRPTFLRIYLFMQKAKGRIG